MIPVSDTNSLIIIAIFMLACAATSAVMMFKCIKILLSKLRKHDPNKLYIKRK